MIETGITKNKIIAQLTRSPHGALSEYVPVGIQAAKQEPEFMAHLLSWNRVNGQVRDSKVALPMITLAARRDDIYLGEFTDNALAHIATLDPRNLVKALEFGWSIQARTRRLRWLVKRYLRHREADWGHWERTAVQYRRALKWLYMNRHFRVRPAPMADRILFKGERPKGSIFEAIANLQNMKPQEAAGTIMKRKIPFLVAFGALGPALKNPDIVLALIERMSATELVTNTKILETLGVKTEPALRAAFEAGLKKVAASKKVTLKTSRAAEAIDDPKLKTKLKAAQEKQLDALGGVDGRWLILADKSQSMVDAIEIARQVAAVLARVAKNEVHLVFFDSGPRYIDATGKSYDELVELTKRMSAGGSTSIGCGLLCLAEKNLEIDGIAIVSDAQENTAPAFVDQYAAFCHSFDKQVPVYLYRCKIGVAGPCDVDIARSMSARGFDLQEFDLRAGVDFYSLPNLVSTMRVSRYSLVDQIMAVPLLKLDDVLAPVKVEAHA